jgi:hypothetical protein
MPVGRKLSILPEVVPHVKESLTCDGLDAADALGEKDAGSEKGVDTMDATVLRDAVADDARHIGIVRSWS